MFLAYHNPPEIAPDATKTSNTRKALACEGRVARDDKMMKSNQTVDGTVTKTTAVYLIVAAAPAIAPATITQPLSGAVDETLPSLVAPSSSPPLPKVLVTLSSA